MPAVDGVGMQLVRIRPPPPPRFMLWFEGEAAKTLVLLDASHGVPLRYTCGTPPTGAAAANAALPPPSAPPPPPWPLAADPSGLLRTRCLADEAAAPGAALPLAGGTSLAARPGDGGGAARLLCLTSGGALDSLEEGAEEEGAAEEEREREGEEAEEPGTGAGMPRGGEEGGEGAGTGAAAPAAVGYHASYFGGPYHEFCREQRPLLPADLKITRLGREDKKLLGQMWKALSAAEKEAYKERYKVKAVASAAAAALRFAVGASVVVVGLKAKPQINGQAASVLGWDAKKGRYNVSLSGGGVIPSGALLALKPANVSAPRMQKIVVTVPPGMAPGEEVQFLTPQTPPQHFNALIPPGCKEGEVFQVEVPMPTRVAAAASAPELRTMKLRVTVPPDAVGGQQVRVMTHLGLQMVQIPNGLQQGDEFDMLCHPDPGAEGVDTGGGAAGARVGGEDEWGVRRVDVTKTAKLAAMVEEATAMMEAAHRRAVPPPPPPPGGADDDAADDRVQTDRVRMPPPPPPSRALPSTAAVAAAELPSGSAAPSSPAEGASQAGEGADPGADQEGSAPLVDTEPRLLAALRTQWGGWEASRSAAAAPPAAATGATPGQAGGVVAMASCASLAAATGATRPKESRRGPRLSWGGALAMDSAPLLAGGAGPAGGPGGRRDPLPSPSSAIPSIRPAASAISQFVPLEAASRAKKPAKRRKSSGF